MVCPPPFSNQGRQAATPSFPGAKKHPNWPKKCGGRRRRRRPPQTLYNEGMAKKRLVVGNWKMYIESPEAARELVQSIKRRTRSMRNTALWIAPPAVLFPAAVQIAKGNGVEIGTQSV